MYFAAQQIYIANSKYLEYNREKEYHVMLKYIKFKMTRWHAIHYTIIYAMSPAKK